MKRIIGGTALFSALLASLIATMLTGFQPPNPSWQNPVLGVIGVVVLGLAAVLIAHGLESIENKEGK